MNHYETLGVPRDATKDEIKNAYRSLAKKHHPDIDDGCDIEANAVMIKINAAYKVLNDSAAREEYDYNLWKSEKRKPAESPMQRYPSYAGLYTPPVRETNPKDELKDKIIGIVIKLIIPGAVLIYLIYAIASGSCGNFFDEFFTYGKSPPSVAEAYFDSLREQDKNRAEKLIGGEMKRISTDVFAAYNLRVGDVAYGEMFYNPERDLSIKTGRTTRDGNYNANIEIEIKNLNVKKIFTAAQKQIIQDIENKRGHEVLQELLREKDLSLVGEVYKIYYEEHLSSSAEYITEKLTLKFYRSSTWHIIDSDDNERLKSALLGGFSEFWEEGSLLVDWEEILGLKENPDEVPWDSTTW